MAVREILKMGHPTLLQSSKVVAEFNTPALEQLIEDMADTMVAANGAGLAAPQIGVLQRVVIFGGGENPRYPGTEPVPHTILINPEIKHLNDSMEEGWEGCLSIPEMRGLVPRYREIEYQGYDPQGNLIQRQAHGFHARVVQHECDHLDGVLYPFRIKDPRYFGFESELFKP
ncbi:MAG: peptide deformylase [Gammaproteobacteria bacterium]|nr:peptide deformylase [Gammaproteobacteria bacterium]